jgi:hypothetical protein
MHLLCDYNRTAVGVSRAVAVALWCWYVLIARCAALEARVVGGLLSVRASLSVLAVSQDTGSHTILTVGVVGSVSNVGRNDYNYTNRNSHKKARELNSHR